MLAKLTLNKSTVFAEKSPMMTTQLRFICTAILGAFLAVFAANQSDAQQVQVDTTRDSAFFDLAPNNNFGNHTHVPVGTANNFSVRRSVFFFDVAAAIPAGATITNATFEFDVTQQGGSQGQVGADFVLHRLTSDWDEGTGETNLGQKTFDGCSWVDSLAGVPWNTPGGDFDATLLGSVFVNNPSGDLATFELGDGNADMVAAVQGMLDSPTTNYGFLMKIDDESLLGSAARVTSREDDDPTFNGFAARLIIDFSAGADPTEVPASSLTVFRGNVVSGGLGETTMSDDQRLIVNLGFTINSSEAPVWLIFDAELSTDAPTSLEISYEANAGTPGLTGTLEAWNFNTSSFDFIDDTDPQFNNDAVVTASLIPADHVEPGTAAVQTRIGWRQTGFTVNFPWQIRVDQVIWIEQ